MPQRSLNKVKFEHIEPFGNLCESGPRSEAELSFGELLEMSGCNNAKRYDVQPTQGSQLLPLRDHCLRSVLLTRPNGQLIRAGQFFFGLTGQRPPNRQFDKAQPLIRDGASYMS